MTYLDHAASTALRPEAREAMQEVWEIGPANPHGAHTAARAARARLDDARERIAALLGASPHGVVFTSGGTESNNWIVSAVASRGAVVYSGVEHPSMVEPSRRVGASSIPVDTDGVVDLDALAALLEDAETPVSLVSVMAANNETGVIEPLGAIAEVVDEYAPDAVLHSDAVQAFGKVPFAVGRGGLDAVTISAHKIGGPIGTGALVIDADIELEPLLCGGGQEGGYRSGTPDAAGAAAFAAAADATFATNWEEIRILRDEFEARLLAEVDGVTVYGAGVDRLPTHSLIGIDGVSNDMLLIACDRADLFVSPGSACASGAAKASGTLEAMGASPDGVLRVSLGWTTTADDIDYALDVIPAVISKLRGSNGRSRRLSR